MAATSPSRAPVTRYRQRPDGRVEHRFEALVAVIALLIVPALIIQESHVPPLVYDIATGVLWLTWAVLVIDFVFILVVATSRKKALRAHWLEALVVFAAMPLPTVLLPQLRFVRLLRLTRLLQVGLIGARVASAERRLSSGARLLNIGLITGLIVVTASLAVTTVDPIDFPNVWRALWWAMVTVTTVGYGDIVPHSVGGRVVAVVLMLLGIGFLSMLTATVAANFIAKDAGLEHAGGKDHQQLVSLLSRIEERLAAVEARLGDGSEHAAAADLGGAAPRPGGSDPPG